MSDLFRTRLFLGALFGLPLALLPGVASTFDETYLYPRLYWIYVLLVPAALAVVWGWRAGAAFPRAGRWLLGSLLVWMLVSILLTGAGWPGFWGQADRADGLLMHLAYALVLFAGWCWSRRETDWPVQLSGAVLLLGGLAALSNVLQQVHIAGIPNQNALSGVIATPFGGTLGHRGYMGGYMALLLPVALWLGAGLPKSRQWWAALAVTLIAWAWLGSATRGAWLAGGAGLLCLLVLEHRFSWRQWWPVALGALLFAGSNAVFHNSRALSLNGENGQALADSSGRTVLWNSAVLGIKQKPLLGWGTPSLLQAMNARPSEKLLAENGIREFKSIRKINRSEKDLPAFQVTYTSGKREHVLLGGGVDKVHNEYLDYALTYGLPVALAFTGLLGWAIWSGRAAAPGLSAGLAAFAVYLFTWPEVVRFAPVAWFFMGVALAAGASCRRVAATVQPCPSPPLKNGIPSPGSSQEAASRS